MNVPKLRFKEFNDEWKKIKYKDVLKIKSGKDQKEIECENGIYPILGTGGQIGTTNIYLYNKPSVLIGRKGTINKPQYMESPFWTVDTLFYSEIFINNLPKFIFYTFQNVNWKKYDESTGVPSLSCNTIENVESYIPEIKEQNKISNFLSLLDKKIELQSKKIEALKLYKKGQIEHDLKSNYPLVKLSDILIERKEYSEKGLEYPHVTLSKEGIFPKSERYNRDFLVKSEDKEYKITRKNDLCYNPANLKFGVICLNEFGSAIFSPIYVTFEIKNNILPQYIKYYVTRWNFINSVRKYEQGTVYERMSVSPEDFLRFNIKLPSKDEQIEFVRKIQLIDKKIFLEQQKIEILESLKKGLMQNMFV